MFTVRKPFDYISSKTLCITWIRFIVDGACPLGKVKTKGTRTTCNIKINFSKKTC